VISFWLGFFFGVFLVGVHPGISPLLRSLLANSSLRYLFIAVPIRVHLPHQTLEVLSHCPFDYFQFLPVKRGLFLGEHPLHLFTPLDSAFLTSPVSSMPTAIIRPPLTRSAPSLSIGVCPAQHNVTLFPYVVTSLLGCCQVDRLRSRSEAVFSHFDTLILHFMICLWPWLGCFGVR